MWLCGQVTRRGAAFILVPTASATPATISAGIAHMQPDCVNGLLQPDVAMQSAKVWPMSTVSYLMVPHGVDKAKTKPDPATVTAIEGLLKYASVDGSKDLPPGYVPLPKDLKAQAAVVTKTIQSAPKASSSTDGAPICPPKPPGGGGSPTPPPTTSGGTGTGTGGATPPPSSPTISTSPAPSTKPATLIVAAPPPPMALTASKASLILPSLVLLGLLTLVTGGLLLYGDRIFRRLAPLGAKARNAVPIGRKPPGGGTG